MPFNNDETVISTKDGDEAAADAAMPRRTFVTRSKSTIITEKNDVRVQLLNEILILCSSSVSRAKGHRREGSGIELQDVFLVQQHRTCGIMKKKCVAKK
jgi:hypothetical protein